MRDMKGLAATVRALSDTTNMLDDKNSWLVVNEKAARPLCSVAGCWKGDSTAAGCSLKGSPSCLSSPTSSKSKTARLPSHAAQSPGMGGESRRRARRLLGRSARDPLTDHPFQTVGE